MIKISPSLMCADLRCLGQQVKECDEAGVDLFHFDLMDAHFVDNLALSPMHLAALRDVTRIPFEAHLMMAEPARYLEASAKAGADIITVHVEVCSNLYQVIGKIRDLHCTPGLAINPATPLCCLDYILPEVAMVTIMTVDPGFAGQKFISAMLPKIRALRETISTRNLKVDIQVDGHIMQDTIPLVVEAGADVLVVGTSGLFGLPGSIRSNIQAIRKQVQSTLAGQKDNPT